MSTRCTATTRAGQPCKAWAVAGSDPPRCIAHGGGSPPAGATRELPSDKPCTHPPPTTAPDPPSIHQVATHLTRWLVHFGKRLDAEGHDLSLDEIGKLLSLYSLAAGRLARLMRTQQSLQAGASQRLDRAINRALDELAKDWGVDL